MNSIKNNKGISLFEIIIVLAVMAIMTAIAALSYKMVDQANVSKAANTLQTAIDSARVTSMAKGTTAGTLHIEIIGGNTYYYIGDVATQKTLICKNNITTTLPGGASVYNVTFNTAGMATSGAANFRFKNGKKICDIALSRLSGKATTTVSYLP